MANEYDGFPALAAGVNDVISDILYNGGSSSVAVAAKKIYLKHVQNDVYSAYTPKEGKWVGGTTYIRRYTLEHGAYVKMEDPTTLIASSDAEADDCVVPGYFFSNENQGFLRLIESGNTGIWKHGFPRPFVTNAQKEFDSSSEISRAIQNEINRVMNS